MLHQLFCRDMRGRLYGNNATSAWFGKMLSVFVFSIQMLVIELGDFAEISLNMDQLKSVLPLLKQDANPLQLHAFQEVSKRSLFGNHAWAWENAKAKGCGQAADILSFVTISALTFRKFKKNY